MADMERRAAIREEQLRKAAGELEASHALEVQALQSQHALALQRKNKQIEGFQAQVGLCWKRGVLVRACMCLQADVACIVLCECAAFSAHAGIPTLATSGCNGRRRTCCCGAIAGGVRITWLYGETLRRFLDTVEHLWCNYKSTLFVSHTTPAPTGHTTRQRWPPLALHLARYRSDTPGFRRRSAS